MNRPRPYLAALIFALVLSGIFTINSSIIDLGIVLFTGLVGYLMVLMKFPFLPAILGVVMGPIVESNYRRSLLLSGRDHSIFLSDAICVGLLVTSAVFIAISLVREVRDARAAKREAEAGAAV